ncbi:hypothetical protein ACODT3_39535 [Streptomyces sp. 4.24]|uniref:hypothetical protein n=1 Tax=Streptomyces tritrimontium TaxID=3406573 RepID=UPI003BB7AE2F
MPVADPRWTYRRIVSEGVYPPEPDVGPVAFLVEETAADSAAARARAAAEQLQAIFDQRPEVRALSVYVADTGIGVAVRADYPPATPPDGPATDGDALDRSGDEERSTQIGRSRHYTAFRYFCDHCRDPVYTPAPEPPSCPRCHGPTGRS